MILIAVSMISLTLLRLLIPKFLIVREAIYSATALYVADSAIELCIYTTRVNTSSMDPAPTKERLIQYYTISGVTVQTDPASCPYIPPGTSFSLRSVGSYKGISRSLEVF